MITAQVIMKYTQNVDQPNHRKYIIFICVCVYKRKEHAKYGADKVQTHKPAASAYVDLFLCLCMHVLI